MNLMVVFHIYLDKSILKHILLEKHGKTDAFSWMNIKEHDSSFHTDEFNEY